MAQPQPAAEITAIPQAVKKSTRLVNLSLAKHQGLCDFQRVTK
jgi:hypothetical protein